MTELRADAPHVGLFNRWHDAYHQALFQASITGRRYRVRFEPNNRWWQITEQMGRHYVRAGDEPRSL